MNRIIILGLISSVLVASCGNSANESATTSTDSSSSAQSNMASGATNNDATALNSASSPDGSFKGVMSKMMQDMQRMQMTNDADHDFAMMMKQHHQGAIDMSNIELSKGTNAGLKQVAQKTIDDSQKDINELSTFLGSHQPSKKGDFGKKQMDKMKSMKMDMNESGDVDKDFVMMMTMHHQEGINMAKDYLKVGTEEATKKIANSTIKSNQEGISKLKAFGGSDMKNMNMNDMKGMDMKDKKGMDMKDTKKDKPATGHSQNQ